MYRKLPSAHMLSFSLIVNWKFHRDQRSFSWRRLFQYSCKRTWRRVCSSPRQSAINRLLKNTPPLIAVSLNSWVSKSKDQVVPSSYSTTGVPPVGIATPQLKVNIPYWDTSPRMSKILPFFSRHWLHNSGERHGQNETGHTGEFLEPCSSSDIVSKIPWCQRRRLDHEVIFWGGKLPHPMPAKPDR